jgi:hypothetical protein
LLNNKNGSAFPDEIYGPIAFAYPFHFLYLNDYYNSIASHSFARTLENKFVGLKSDFSLPELYILLG